MFRALRRLFSRLFRRSSEAEIAAEREGAAAPRANSDPDRPSPPNPAPRSSQGSTVSPENSGRSQTGRSRTGQPQPKPASAPSSIANLKPVLNVLRAYVATLGRPTTTLELRAVIGAIVANVQTVAIENDQLEGFIDEAIAAFESLGLNSSLVDVTTQLLAEQVAVWMQEQENTVSNVISAYLQQFAPMGKVWDGVELVGLVQTVVSSLNKGELSRSGGRLLVDRVVKAFDLDQAISRWVAPEWVGLAQRVARYLEKGNLQTELQSIAWAYVQKFQSILSPQLIEQIITRGPLNISSAELLSGDLGEFSQMLYYKFQLLEADPVVTKSHEAIAADIHRAVTEFNANRDPVPDITEGIQTGELEISSPFTSPRNADAESGD